MADGAKLVITKAGMAELADAADSKSAEVHPSWGFDPPSRHHAKSFHFSIYLALGHRYAVR